MATKIPAFLDGNTFVHFNDFTGRLFGGNSGGLIKVFDPETDSEPTSIDIPENITSLTTHGDKLLVTTTASGLVLLSVGSVASGEENFAAIYKSDYAFRDVVFINDGKRSICGGDAPKFTIIDHLDGNKTTEIELPDWPVNFAYCAAGEVVAVTLSNGDIHVYSVINENPIQVHVISNGAAAKHITSTEIVYLAGEHSDELLCTKCAWMNNGEVLLVPAADGAVNAYLRSDWSISLLFPRGNKRLTSFALSLSQSTVALLYENGSVDFYNTSNAEKVSSLDQTISSGFATNVAWTNLAIFFGATSGEMCSYLVLVEEESEPTISKEVNLLFIDEADQSDTDQVPGGTGIKHSLYDSDIIDEDEGNINGNSYKYYNESIENVLLSRKKKKFAKELKFASQDFASNKIVPYSPGSTPWIRSTNTTNSTSKRRYLFMSSIGYAWSLRNFTGQEIQRSITVSFFDRSVNKDYHFIDYNNLDLCSMNEKGLLLGCSGYEEDQKAQKGKILYRHHVNANDSWERQIPLLKGEYLTSIALTTTADPESGESLVVVGTNLGYLRFFNLYGLCINLLKTSPVVASIASLLDTVFIVHQSGYSNFSYSIINVAEDCNFMQQEKPLPLRESEGPLIKGLFYNEYSDPCLVAGNDDALTILSHWREPNNARWVPILNCKEIVTEYGLTESKKNWSCWPLGFHEETFVAMVLKTTDSYPGFPLPLPVDFEVRMPVKCFRAIVEQKDMDDYEDEAEAKLARIQEYDPEEEFLRASTFGKLLSSSMADLDNDEKQLEKLNGYSVIFDKSLLKLFNNACQSSRLNKAYSIVKLIKNDKALLAATKIGERHNFNNLVAKINKLREELMELEAEE